jgi:translation initiation factor IF-3
MTNYRRKRGKPKEISKKFFVNERIPFFELKVIDDESKMLGIMSKDEALALADEQDKDLVLINPKGEPPVVKLIEYSKFKYLLDKAEKSKTKGGDEIKTLLVSVRIAPHDMKVQAKKADEFLTKGIKTRLQVRMERREKSHPEIAVETMTKFLSMITFEYFLESEPKLMGDSCIALLKPKK